MGSGARHGGDDAGTSMQMTRSPARQARDRKRRNAQQQRWQAMNGPVVAGHLDAPTPPPVKPKVPNPRVAKSPRRAPSSLTAGRCRDCGAYGVALEGRLCSICRAIAS